jgi:two-component system alkaline phosphatase synthesis response regulator PhoP
LVLLDIMLPGETGLSILSWIRSVPELRQIPVMMLSAKDSEYDKVLALDSGADDYLAKPFGMMELTSRCRALLRRPTMIASNNSGADDTVTVGCLSLSAKDHRAFAGNEELDLTLKEFELLRKLMGSPGQAFTRARLLEEIWDITFIGSTRTLDTHVQTLRRKLNNASAGAGEAIETVRGVGYRLAREEKP